MDHQNTLKYYLSTLDLPTPLPSPQAMSEVASGLATNVSLVTLRVTHSDCGETACAHFSRALKRNGTLRSLSLDHCEMSSASLAALIPPAVRGGTLERLSAMGNGLGQEPTKGARRSL
jgi:hypothetical protein